MALNLKIENETRLPDGGPLTYALAGHRGADIGRDTHLDWSLPDASRFISGKHCEIRYQDGGYLLFDVSRNGTFLNGQDRRMQSPHRLRSGDRLMIGHYIIAVEVTGEAAAEPSPPLPPTPQPRRPPEFETPPWHNAPFPPPAAAPPQAPSEPPRDRSDFLNVIVDVPNLDEPGFVRQALAANSLPSKDPAPSRNWWDPPPPPAISAVPPLAAPPPQAVSPQAEPPPPLPSPVRPLYVSSEPDGPWSQEPSSKPVPVPPPQPQSSGYAATGNESDILARFAKGAGLAPGALTARDSGEFAEQLGRLMLLVTENMKHLLAARADTKRAARSANQTMIEALDNNPLKFSPTAAAALRIMLEPQTGGYLGPEQALRQSFEDLKAHQIQTFSAMQRALQMLVEDIDPKSIESDPGLPKGIAAWFGSRKARFWTLYEARWRSKTSRHEGSMLPVFMQYFADVYDRTPAPGEGSGRQPRP